ncbi:MAG: HD-GYP domain-containing protein [Gemmatimonadota bacterium]
MTELDRPRPSDAATDAFLRQSGRALLLSLHAALRSLKLYPLENATVQKALDDLMVATRPVLEAEGRIEMRLAGDFIFVNSTRLRLEMDNYASFSQLLTVFRSFEIGTLRVSEGIQRRDWQVFLSLLLSLASRAGGEEVLGELKQRMAAAEVTSIEVAFGLDAEALEAAEEAREAAKRTYAQGVAVTKELMNGIRLGRTTNLKRVKRAVQSIVDQVLTNDISLIGLTTLRDYDEYTFTHSVNVCIFSVAIGRKVGLSRLQLYDLGLCALLHDVGKVRIPVEVLNKTTGLDEAEWRLMQSHPWRGALALFSMRGYEETPYRAILTAHEHHMKTDLTGYPRCLRPRELGIFSRIVAVADGFDAATTRRSYQTIPIQPDQVLREMWENPKRGYDRVLVKALINLLGIYPVGTCVILDTMEVALVAGPSPDPNYLNRPMVRVVLDSVGAPEPPPGVLVNLTDQDLSGNFLRSIVKVTDPARYGINVGDYFV